MKTSIQDGKTSNMSIINNSFNTQYCLLGLLHSNFRCLSGSLISGAGDAMKMYCRCQCILLFF